MNLIEALRATADRIEAEPDQYNWDWRETCNCGMLAQTLIGLNAESLDSRLSEAGVERASWETMLKCAEDKCSITGLPNAEIFQTLANAGLTAKDLIELEDCSNQIIQNRMPKYIWDSHSRICDFDKPTVVVAYMRAWADLLEENQSTSVVLGIDQDGNEAEIDSRSGGLM